MDGVQVVSCLRTVGNESLQSRQLSRSGAILALQRAGNSEFCIQFNLQLSAGAPVPKVYLASGKVPLSRGPHAHGPGLPLFLA